MTQSPEFPNGEFPDQGRDPTEDEIAEWYGFQWARENDRCGDPELGAMDLTHLIGQSVWVQMGRLVMYGTLIDDTGDVPGPTRRYAIEDTIVDGVIHSISFRTHRVRSLSEMGGLPYITLNVSRT